MFRDLLDALRCPRDHEESWLVAMVSKANGPILLEAELACPMCGAEFIVRDGVAHFGEPARAVSASIPDPERVAALLGVPGGHQPVLLTGHYARAGAALSLLSDAPQLWLDAPPDAAPDGPAISQITGASRLPLGADTLAAAAIDAVHTHPALLQSIVRAVRQGGRIVAPAETPLPDTLRELARDAQEWVAETTTRPSGLTQLRRTARQ